MTIQLSILDIAMEKALIMQRFNEVNDKSLIQAIKKLLDFDLSKQSAHKYDEALEASLKEAIEQSNKREVLPHKEVWAEIRERYKAIASFIDASFANRSTP